MEHRCWPIPPHNGIIKSPADIFLQGHVHDFSGSCHTVDHILPSVLPQRPHPMTQSNPFDLLSTRFIENDSAHIFIDLKDLIDRGPPVITCTITMITAATMIYFDLCGTRKIQTLCYFLTDLGKGGKIFFFTFRAYLPD